MKSKQENHSLLIVEDDQDLNQTLVDLLEPLCSKIYTAHDGIEALALIESQPDLCAVLSDIDMPKMDGLELLARLRQANNPLPFVLMSGQPDSINHLKAIELHATDFLTKPFTASLILEVMKRAIHLGAERPKP